MCAFIMYFVNCIRQLLSFLCGQKDEEPDVVLVKVEEVEPAARPRNQACLSIQEGEQIHSA